MDKLLVAGVDTTLGANLAAWLANRYQVVGLAWGQPLTIAECQTAQCDPTAVDAPRQWIASERPNWVVYCGPGAESSWNLPAPRLPRTESVPAAGAWGRAAAEFGCALTAISSDAVFTGPWMFHRESGAGFCESTPAKILRMIEQELVEACPNALLVRTNAFGWSPRSEAPGLVETALTALEDCRDLTLDCVRHATPILATDLADVLATAYQANLQGTYHIAGGERINPFRFACLLASEFGLPMSTLSPSEIAYDARREYGAGETSLQTRRIRKALETALPLIRDGLGRLHEQHASGYRARFGITEAVLAEQVA